MPEPRGNFTTSRCGWNSAGGQPQHSSCSPGLASPEREPRARADGRPLGKSLHGWVDLSHLDLNAHEMWQFEGDLGRCVLLPPRDQVALPAAAEGDGDPVVVPGGDTGGEPYGGVRQQVPDVLMGLN